MVSKEDVLLASKQFHKRISRKAPIDPDFIQTESYPVKKKKTIPDRTVQTSGLKIVDTAAQPRSPQKVKLFVDTTPTTIQNTVSQESQEMLCQQPEIGIINPKLILFLLGGIVYVLWVWLRS